MHLDTIKHQFQCQKPNEAIHRPHQTQRIRKRRNERNRKANAHDRDRARNQDSSSSALEAGDLRRAQQVHDQSLRQQPFEEPLRVEDLDALDVVGVSDAVVEPIQAEGADIDGT